MASRIIEGSLEVLRPFLTPSSREREKEGWPSSSARTTTARTKSGTTTTTTGGGVDKGPGESPTSSSGVVEEGAAAEAGKGPTSSLYEEKWQTKFDLLQKYRRQHGDCRVPVQYEIDGVKLGQWLQTQKKAYRKHTEGQPSWIAQERIDQLQAVGVDFADTQQKREEGLWQSKLELLQKYQQQHGHCNVPQSCFIAGVKLGSWVDTQRTAYKKRIRSGEPSFISQSRIDALNSVGFDWDPKHTKNLASGVQSMDESPSEDELSAAVTHQSSRKRMPVADTVFNQSPLMGRQQSRKALRRNDGSRLAVTSESRSSIQSTYASSTSAVANASRRKRMASECRQPGNIGATPKRQKLDDRKQGGKRVSSVEAVGVNFHSNEKERKK